MSDNRANEPTPEQVEAAAKAIADCHNPGMFERYPENWRVEARAALVAAQCAAPQAERDWRLDVVPEPWTAPAPVLPSSGVDEDALVQRVYDELMADDAVAEVWSNSKVMATARRIVKFAVQGGESRDE
jgi:hypothetical protein